MQKLTNVHEALARAGSSEKKLSPMETHSFREHANIVVRAEKICARHGTTVGAYIRECLRGLLKDYKE